MAWPRRDVVRGAGDAHQGDVVRTERDRPTPTSSKKLKEDLYRLKKELKDDDQFEKELPKDNE